MRHCHRKGSRPSRSPGYVSARQARTGGGGGASGDEQLERIADGIASKLPADFDLEHVKEKFPVAYLESMNTVLIQAHHLCACAFKVVFLGAARMHREHPSTAA